MNFLLGRFDDVDYINCDGYERNICRESDNFRFLMY